jgi:hypothetical protein
VEHGFFSVFYWKVIGKIGKLKSNPKHFGIFYTASVLFSRESKQPEKIFSRLFRFFGGRSQSTIKTLIFQDLPRCVGAKRFSPLLALSGQINCPCGVKKPVNILPDFLLRVRNMSYLTRSESKS